MISAKTATENIYYNVNVIKCKDCIHKVFPKSLIGKEGDGQLCSRSFISLKYIRCSVDDQTYMYDADRDCLKYRQSKIILKDK